MAEPRERLFFALWPEPALAQAIGATVGRVVAERRLRGQPVPPERAHLTVLFLGEVAPAARAQLEAAAGALRVRPFELVLDQVGCFFRSRVLWAGPSAIPPPLLELWEGLRAAAEAAGVGRPYTPLVPHVTCLRELRDRIRPVPVKPVRWRVREFALVRSPEYHVVSQWPLHTGRT